MGWSWLLVLLFLGSPFCRALRTPGTTGTTTTTRLTTTQGKECLPCHIVRPHIVFDEDDDNDEEEEDELQQPLPLMCVTKRPDRSYRESFEIDLPEAFLEAYKHLIDAGDAFVCIEGGSIDQEGQAVVMPTVIVTSDADADAIELHATSFKHDRQLRQLQQQSSTTAGTKQRQVRLLVVRVVDVEGTEPVDSVDVMEGAIFGTGVNPQNISFAASVVQQYAAISHEKFALVPVLLQGANNIAAGVAEVVIGIPVQGAPLYRRLVPELLNATEAALGPLDELADTIIFCLPDGATANGKTSWTAIATIWEPYSYYQKSRCTKLSYVMHELGHSVLGFEHSSSRDDEFGDISCYMGFSRNVTAYPRKSFNAHKHWLSGWFSDRATTVNTTMQWDTGRRLVSFVDYGSDELVESDLVLLRVGNLYIHYNRAKGYNLETKRADMVLITKAESDVDLSIAQAHLAAGQNFTYSNFTDTGTALVIEVCAIAFNGVDYAVLNIFLDDGQQWSSCPDTNAPSPGSASTAPSTLNQTQSVVPYPSAQSEPPSPIPQGLAAPTNSPVVSIVPSMAEAATRENATEAPTMDPGRTGPFENETITAAPTAVASGMKAQTAAPAMPSPLNIEPLTAAPVVAPTTAPTKARTFTTEPLSSPISLIATPSASPAVLEVEPVSGLRGDDEEASGNPGQNNSGTRMSSALVASLSAGALLLVHLWG